MFSLPPEMRKKYLQRRLSEVDILKQSLVDKSVHEFNKIGHQLMGSAANYGFVGLESIAAKMEQLTSGDLQALGPKLIEDFSQWLSENLVNKS